MNKLKLQTVSCDSYSDLALLGLRYSSVKNNMSNDRLVNILIIIFIKR